MGGGGGSSFNWNPGYSTLGDVFGKNVQAPIKNSGVIDPNNPVRTSLNVADKLTQATAPLDPLTYAPGISGFEGLGASPGQWIAKGANAAGQAATDQAQNLTNSVTGNVDDRLGTNIQKTQQQGADSFGVDTPTKATVNLTKPQQDQNAKFQKDQQDQQASRDQQSAQSAAAQAAAAKALSDQQQASNQNSYNNSNSLEQALRDAYTQKRRSVPTAT